MRIAIIGAGFTGLTSAYRLSQKGHEVTVFEKESQPGGLAIGVQAREWKWTLEQHYHHWFTNDSFILGLAKEIGHQVIIKHPRTSVLVDDHIYQFDSLKSILLFPKLSYPDKLRMAAIVGILRYDPFWKGLEGLNASQFLPKAMGRAAYEMIWEPQFKNKFGSYADQISLAWFWARIKKRTSSLAYPQGGFLEFAKVLTKKISELGGNVHFDTETVSLEHERGVRIQFRDKSRKIKREIFDAAIVTLPSFLFLRIAPQLPDEYKNSLIRLRGLGATNLVLRLRKPFFPDNTYWLSVCDASSPVMAVVEHTNFMDKRHYNNEHIVYLGNYLPADHPKFLASKEKLLTMYDPFLRKINKEYKKHLIDYMLFKAPFAQPIIPPHYSQMIPPLTTPLPNVYLANIEQVYPWDRGTNYSVELGENAARLVDKK